MCQPSLFIIVIALLVAANGDTNLDHCDDPVICVDKPKDYESHQEKIDEIIERNKALINNEFFDMELGESRISGDQENCIAETTVEKPFVIKTNISSNIVVQSQNFEQKILITRCSSPGKPCFTSVSLSDSSLETFCEEKYGAVSLYIFDPAVNDIRYKMFEVPVCCVCKMRNPMKK